MRSIATSIRINAPVAAVWQVLRDTREYPRWNPFITSVVGDLVVGGRPTLRIAAQGKAPMTFRPRIVAASPDIGLRWRGRLLVPGLCDADHQILLTPVLGGATLLIQRETFRGALVPFLGGMMAPTRAGFEAMNAALQQRAEALHERHAYAAAGSSEPL